MYNEKYDLYRRNLDRVYIRLNSWFNGYNEIHININKLFKHLEDFSFVNKSLLESLNQTRN